MRRTFFVVCLALAGCATQGADPTAELEGSTGTVGLLHVDLGEPSATPGLPRAPNPALEPEPELSVHGGNPRAILGAAFARYRGLEGTQVARLLGGLGHDVPLEACALTAFGDEGAPAGAQIELLDVGAIEVQLAEARDAGRLAGLGETRLTARTFPELGGVASGLFYAGDAVLDAREGDALSFRALGGLDLPGFDVQVVAPAAVTGLLAERTREGLELGWDAADPRDTMELELQSATRVIACRASDDGALRVPSDLLSALPSGDVRLVVRRVRVQAFDAVGVDTAFARVVTQRSATVRVF